MNRIARSTRIDKVIFAGVTGMWQVGKRSDTDEYSERVDLDTWYILNHNIWLDLKIIFKTIGVMFSRKGAY